tara:strand:+ start:835 stop:936 length:102 start_codon:yes stop_codon:yes gene_type:complete
MQQVGRMELGLLRRAILMTEKSYINEIANNIVE